MNRPLVMISHRLLSMYWHNRPSIAIMWVHALHKAYGAYLTHQPEVDRKISHLALAGRTIHPLTMDHGSDINHDVWIALAIKAFAISLHSCIDLTDNSLPSCESMPNTMQMVSLYQSNHSYPFWSRSVRTLSVPTRSYPFGHDPYTSHGSWYVRTFWITTRSYLLDHDMIADLGSPYIRFWITMHPLVIGTVWSSYPLILATLGILYL